MEPTPVAACPPYHGRSAAGEHGHFDNLLRVGGKQVWSPRPASPSHHAADRPQEEYLATLRRLAEALGVADRLVVTETLMLDGVREVLPVADVEDPELSEQVAANGMIQ